MAPLYEYKCMKCKKVMELQQKISERFPPICVEEGCSIEMVPVISKSSFSLKGSGWERDGYSSVKK